MTNQQRGLKTLTKWMTIIAILTSNVYALPYGGTNISALTSKISTENIGTLIGDHLNKKTVYVQPGSKKFQGKFYLTNGGIDCQDLFNLRKLTYRMPTEEEFSKIVENNQTYSPAFASSVGVTAKNLNLSKKIVDAKFKVLKYIEDHKNEYGLYAAAKSELELARSEAKSIRGDINQLNNDLINNLTLANSEDEKYQLRSQHKTSLQAMVMGQRSIQSKVTLAAQKYHTALVGWAPYKDQFAWLSNIESNLAQSFERIQSLAEGSLIRSEKLIQLLERKVVGYASASYSLGVESEIATLHNRMRDAGINDYSLRPLPVFNVRLNPGVTKKINKMKDAGIGVDYQLISYHFPYNTQMLVSTAEEFKTIPVKIQKEFGEQEELRFLMSDLDGSFGGSQSFEIPVTQGAICGYAKSKQRHYNYTDNRGNRMGRTVNQTVYESPAANQAVFIQNVALRYHFYEKSDPIAGKCRLDISKMDRPQKVSS